MGFVKKIVLVQMCFQLLMIASPSGALAYDFLREIDEAEISENFITFYSPDGSTSVERDEKFEQIRQMADVAIDKLVGSDEDEASIKTQQAWNYLSVLYKKEKVERETPQRERLYKMLLKFNTREQSPLAQEPMGFQAWVSQQPRDLLSEGTEYVRPVRNTGDCCNDNRYN